MLGTMSENKLAWIMLKKKIKDDKNLVTVIWKNKSWIVSTPI